MTTIIELKELTKKYESTVALDHVNLTFERGRVYGLIGRNGAGKTTMLKLISSMVQITKGSIDYNQVYIQSGTDIAFGRDNNFYFSNYTLKSLVDLGRKIYPNWSEATCKALIELFELDLKKRYIKASKGMQTMMSIVIALSSGCEVILLDEPYSGLDPINREHFYDYLRNHFFDGERTIVISSHLIQEIEGYFERAIIIDKGKILLDQEMTELYDMSFEITCNEALYKALKVDKNVLKTKQLAGNYVLSIYDRFTADELGAIKNQGGLVKTMDLQALFIALCMKGGKDDEIA